MRIAPLLPTLFGFLLASCQGFEDAPHCGQVPVGGCPTSRGGSCNDKYCSALYSCTTQGWNLVTVCPAVDAGPDDGAGPDDAAQDAAVMTCADVEVPKSEPSQCTEPLLYEDCPVEAAQGCGVQACLVGCANFFACQRGAWQLVGYCDEETVSLIWVDAS